MGKNIIEKAKVGDTKTYQGKQYYVHALNSKGQPLWRQVGSKKDSGSDSQAPAAKQQPAAQAAPATAPTQTGAPAAQTDQKTSTYQKPKAKVKYSVAPPIEIDIPEQWDIKLGNGTVKTAHRDKLIEMYEGFDDAKLISRFNDGKVSAKNLQLMYDQLAARGVDENKLKIPKKLKDFWKKEEERVNRLKSLTTSNADNDEEEDYETTTEEDTIGEGDISEMAEDQEG